MDVAQKGFVESLSACGSGPLKRHGTARSKVIPFYAQEIQHAQWWYIQYDYKILYIYTHVIHPITWCFHMTFIAPQSAPSWSVSPQCSFDPTSGRSQGPGCCVLSCKQFEENVKNTVIPCDNTNFSKDEEYFLESKSAPLNNMLNGDITSRCIHKEWISISDKIYWLQGVHCSHIFNIRDGHVQRAKEPCYTYIYMWKYIITSIYTNVYKIKYTFIYIRVITSTLVKYTYTCRKSADIAVQKYATLSRFRGGQTSGLQRTY